MKKILCRNIDMTNLYPSGHMLVGHYDVLPMRHNEYKGYFDGTLVVVLTDREQGVAGSTANYHLSGMFSFVNLDRETGSKTKVFHEHISHSWSVTGLDIQGIISNFKYMYPITLKTDSVEISEWSGIDFENLPPINEDSGILKSSE